MNTIGAQRPLKFAKYLPEFGIEPIVVTANEETCRSLSLRLDPTPLGELVPNCQIERVPSDPLPLPGNSRLRVWLRNFFWPNDPIGWMWRRPLAARVATLLREGKVDAMYATIPPFSLGPLVRRLARQHHLPLLLDMRDPWSQWGQSPRPSWLHHRMQVGQERRCIAGSHRTFAVSEPMRENLLAEHPMISPDRLRVIPNGHELNLQALLAEPRAARGNGPFVIGHVGTFWYSPGSHQSTFQPFWKRPPWRMAQFNPRREDWFYQTPHAFFRGLARLLAEEPARRGQVRVRFAGECPPWLDGMVAGFGLEDVVEHLGHLDRHACAAFEASCDALLITSVKVVGGVDYRLPGKLYNYLAAGRPILGVLTPGSTRDFVEQCGLGVLANPDDPEDVAEKLRSLMAGRFSFLLNRTFLAKFHRRETTRMLAQAVREAVQAGGALAAT